MKLLSRSATPLTLVLFALIWSLCAWFLQPDAGGALVLLPGPVQVLEALNNLIVKEDFLGDILVSVLRIAIGLLSALVPAFILGLAFGTNPRLSNAAAPLFAFAKYVPPVAFIPILILWLGVGLQQQLALLFIGTFFHLTVMISTTVANTPSTFIDAARTLGASRWQTILKVLIRFGLPEFFEHLRTIVGVAWTYLIVVEMVATENGIGRVIINSQRYLQTGKVLAGVLTIGILGVLIDQLLQLASWLFCRWKHEHPPLLARPFTRVPAA